MINGLEGIPGSGKSYEAVAYHVLDSLQKGRLVVTNLPLFVDMFAAINPEYRKLIELRVRPAPIRGTWDASRVETDEHGNMSGEAFRLFEDGHVEQPAPSVRTFGHVWDYYHPWKDAKGNGPLFVVDECHVPLPKIGTDPQVVEWFKLHRHFNADVLLMTQNFRRICADISDLLAMLVKCRKADILGDSGSYIRKVHGGYRGAVISTETRKYNPAYFKLYKSHTQGNSVAEQAASDVSPFLVKFNRFKWFVVSVAVGMCVWAFWPTPQKAKPAAAAAKPAWLVEAERNKGKPLLPANYSDPEPVAQKLAVAAPGGKTQPVGTPAEIPEPYATKGLHVNGFIRMGGKTQYMLTVSENGATIGSVSESELVRAGYVFHGVSDCVATVQWRDRVRSITCDAPALTLGYQPTVKAPEVKTGPAGNALAVTAAAPADSGLTEVLVPQATVDGARIGAMRAGNRIQ